MQLAANEQFADLTTAQNCRLLIQSQDKCNDYLEGHERVSILWLPDLDHVGGGHLTQGFLGASHQQSNISPENRRHVKTNNETNKQQMYRHKIAKYKKQNLDPPVTGIGHLD